MTIVVAILLNALLLSALAGWLCAQYRQPDALLRRWLLPALGWRLLLTALSSARPGPDALAANAWSRVLTNLFRKNPANALSIWQGTFFQGNSETINFYKVNTLLLHKWSNTLFFIKLLAALNLATTGLLWLNALYLSLGCFVACWSLVRALTGVWPAAPRSASIVAFLLWPTVVWWTAGFTKETLLVGTAAGLLALVLPALYAPRRASLWPAVGHWVGGLLLAWVMVRMRYFFALPLLGCLLVLAAVRLATLRGWLRPGWRPQLSAVGLLLLAGAGAIGLLGGPAMLDFFSFQVENSFSLNLLHSLSQPHLAAHSWPATPAQVLRHAPLAAGQVLVRPWLGESAAPLYVGAALENCALSALVLVALVAAWRGRAGRLPIALVALLLVYCLLLAAFIGLSTANLGTLNRYRVVLLPWLLLLLMQNDYARAALRRLGLGA